MTADSVLVLKHAGPLGAPGMPEWGQLPIPKKILATGVRDMVRISDARMSGTSYGACVLHVAPESYVGGPLALVEDGDMIELDVPARRLELKVSADELARRRAAWTAAGAEIRARLRRALPAAHHAGRPGLRFRFSRRHRADAGSGDPLDELVPTTMPDRRRIRSSTELVAAIMHGAGCGDGEAATIARRLVDSNLVGHDSHGVLRVATYLDWIKDGTLRPNTAPTLVFDSDTIAIIDGNRGFGQVTGEFAAKLGIAQGEREGHRDDRPAQLRAPRPRRRLGGPGGRGGPGVAALSQHVGRAARRPLRRQRPPALDQSDHDRRARRRRGSGRCST